MLITTTGVMAAVMMVAPTIITECSISRGPTLGEFVGVLANRAVINRLLFSYLLVY